MSLADRVRDASLLWGDFVLSSGQRSSFYIDKYLFSTDPLLLKDLAREVAQRLPEGVQKLAGVELGAVPLVVAVALEAGIPYVIVRKSAKEHGTARQIEGRLEPKERVVLLEDVVTTGTQALAAAQVLKAEDVQLLKVIAVLDRRSTPGALLGEVPFEALFGMPDFGIAEA